MKATLYHAWHYIAEKSAFSSGEIRVERADGVLTAPPTPIAEFSDHFLSTASSPELLDGVERAAEEEACEARVAAFAAELKDILGGVVSEQLAACEGVEASHSGKSILSALLDSVVETSCDFVSAFGSFLRVVSRSLRDAKRFSLRVLRITLMRLLELSMDASSEMWNIVLRWLASVWEYVPDDMRGFFSRAKAYIQARIVQGVQDFCRSASEMPGSAPAAAAIVASVIARSAGGSLTSVALRLFPVPTLVLVKLAAEVQLGLAMKRWTRLQCWLPLEVQAVADLVVVTPLKRVFLGVRPSGIASLSRGTRFFDLLSTSANWATAVMNLVYFMQCGSIFTGVSVPLVGVCLALAVALYRSSL